MQTIIGLVAGGLGIALVPSSLRNLRRTGVVYKTLQDQPTEVEMGVIWRRADSSSVLRSFLGVVEGFPRRDIGGDGDAGFNYASITDVHPPVRPKQDSQY